MRFDAALGIVILLAPGGIASDEIDTPAAVERRSAIVAARAGKLDEAIRLATRAIEIVPADPDAYQLRAGLFAAQGEHQRAVDDYDRLLKLAPERVEAYDQRGSQQFMLGHIGESIEDFDRFIERRPDQERWHWKRGISYYYAGRYEDGRRQFEGYQTVDDNDVENAVWRYLCMARSEGVPAAREAMLNIKNDRRVPMMQVYELYSGKLQPDDVLAAARAGSPSPEALNAQLFYAHLYLGLYFEVAGDVAQAQSHLTAAIGHKIGHYMWNVAEVHTNLLKQAKR